jgi:hypothetical protein
MTKLFLLCSLLLTGFYFAGAQPNVVFPNLDVKEGDQFTVGLPVQNFNNIVGVQFSLQWNPDVIQFVSAGGVNLPNASEPFGETFVDSGILTFLWITADITTGITLDSGQTIFTVQFKAVGTQGDSTILAITSTPTPIVVLNNTGTNVGLTHEGGLIKIDEPLSSINQNPGEQFYFSLYPTTTHGPLNLEANAQNYISSKVSIYSLSGVCFFAEPWLLSPGKNVLSLNIGHRLPNGIYTFVIDTGQVLKSTRFVISR